MLQTTPQVLRTQAQAAAPPTSRRDRPWRVRRRAGPCVVRTKEPVCTSFLRNGTLLGSASWTLGLSFQSKRRLSPLPPRLPLRCRRPSPKAGFGSLGSHDKASWRWEWGRYPFEFVQVLSNKSQEHDTRAVSTPICSQGELLRCTALTTLGIADSLGKKTACAVVTILPSRASA